MHVILKVPKLQLTHDISQTTKFNKFQNAVVESPDDLVYHKPVRYAHILDSDSESDCYVSILYLLLTMYAHTVYYSMWPSVTVYVG